MSCKNIQCLEHPDEEASILCSTCSHMSHSFPAYVKHLRQDSRLFYAHPFDIISLKIQSSVTLSLTIIVLIPVLSVIQLGVPTFPSVTVCFKSLIKVFMHENLLYWIPMKKPLQCHGFRI